MEYYLISLIITILIFGVIQVYEYNKIKRYIEENGENYYIEPYSIFNITSAYNNNKFTLAFPTGAAAGTYTNFNVVIPDGFYTIPDLTAFMRQFAITNGLYLIDNNGAFVYYTPDFYVNQTSYSIQILLYTVPRSLPTGWTQPGNWIGFSTFTSD